MADTVSAPLGTVLWRDLTVPDAERVRDFYQQVVGWSSAPVEMGGYSDYSMIPPSGTEPVAGVCHARGVNADLPPQWLMYIVVEDLDRSMEDCVRLDGRIVSGPRSMGGARFAVIADPAGAVCALWQPLAAA